MVTTTCGFPFSDFDDGTLQGWSESETFLPTSGVLDNPGTGGNPSGFARVYDSIPRGGNLSIVAPAPFLGDLSLYAGIEYDSFVFENPVPPLITQRLTIRGADAGYYIDASPLVVGAWTHQEAPFDETLWQRWEGAGTATFLEALRDVTAVRVRMDVSTNSIFYESGIDNFRLVPRLDCNDNGVPDEEDIADGTSDDCNSNGIPDDCEPDCNDNGLADSCDLSTGTSADCNGNCVPDDCEPNEDCNDNGVQDICDIANGTSGDCNESLVPDECELAAGVSDDCNTNDIPDECELDEDCNSNAILDQCETDADEDGLIDACDNCPEIDNPAQENQDHDSAGDVCDECPTDWLKVLEGVCGCFVPDVDSDRDGAPDCVDECPLDPNKIASGECGCGTAETGDTDEDGVADCNDLCSGVDDGVFAPQCEHAVPTVSTWGLIIMALLLLAVGKVYFGPTSRGLQPTEEIVEIVEHRTSDARRVSIATRVD